MSSTAASAAERSRGVVFVAAAALFWSLGGLLARVVDTDTWTTVFWRSIFAAAFLLGVTLFQEGRAAWPRVHRIAWGMGWPGVAMALCFATASTCFINALARTTVANTLVIQSTSPFIAALLGWAWMGERVRPRSWLAMAAALAGATVMASHSWGAGTIGGDLLALVTAFAFAAATVIVRRHRALRMTAAAGLAGVFSAVFAWRPARPLEAAPDDLALLALFGAAQLGFGLVLFTAGARLIPVAEASLIAVLESVLGPVWVWLALGETPAPAALVGGAIILAALIVHTALDLRTSHPEGITRPLEGRERRIREP
jgi:drug/metabolite transporter (DMT)-like permease